MVKNAVPDEKKQIDKRPRQRKFISSVENCLWALTRIGFQNISVHLGHYPAEACGWWSFFCKRMTAKLTQFIHHGHGLSIRRIGGVSDFQQILNPKATNTAESIFVTNRYKNFGLLGQRSKCWYHVACCILFSNTRKWPVPFYSTPRKQAAVVRIVTMKPSLESFWCT